MPVSAGTDELGTQAAPAGPGGALRTGGRPESFLAKVCSQVSFGQECCQDLQVRLRPASCLSFGAMARQQQSQSEQRIQRERGRFAVVSRLEGVLPKQILLKALA